MRQRALFAVVSLVFAGVGIALAFWARSLRTEAHASRHEIVRLNDQRRRFCASVQAAMVNARLDVTSGKAAHAQDTLAQQTAAVEYCTDDRVSFPVELMLKENPPDALAPAIQHAIDELEASMTTRTLHRR